MRRLGSVVACQVCCFVDFLVFRRAHYCMSALVFAVSHDHLSKSLLHAKSRLALAVGLLIIQNLKLSLSDYYSIFSVNSCSRLSEVGTNICDSKSGCIFSRSIHRLYLDGIFNLSVILLVQIFYVD